MIAELNSVWSVFGSIASALSNDILMAISFVFAAIGVVGIFRTL